MRKSTIASRCCRLTSRYCRIAGVADAEDGACAEEDEESSSRAGQSRQRARSGSNRRSITLRHGRSGARDRHARGQPRALVDGDVSTRDDGRPDAHARRAAAAASVTDWLARARPVARRRRSLCGRRRSGIVHGAARRHGGGAGLRARDRRRAVVPVPTLDALADGVDSATRRSPEPAAARGRASTDSAATCSSRHGEVGARPVDGGRAGS